jgi:L-amino acid N-acyltransferase YncA
MIRLASPDDLILVALLWEDMIREEFHNGISPDPISWRRIFSDRMMNNENFTMLVDENGEGIVGYISGEVYPEPADGKVHGISQSIYVKPPYRNGRVGLSLYHSLAKVFVGQGAQVIEFLCKPDRIPFWNKKGYECKSVVMSMNARELSKAYGG